MEKTSWIRCTICLLLVFSFIFTSIGMVAADEGARGDRQDERNGREDGDDARPEEDMEFPRIGLERSQVDIMGGGEFVGLMNSDKDAFMGIIHGTEDNPNTINIVSMYTRYLGTANVTDENGQQVATNRPIPVKTIYTQSFETIFEYVDENGDGYYNREILRSEPLVKRVSLNTAWKMEDISKVELSNGTHLWNLSLTATNLSYMNSLRDVELDTDERLDRVTLTFHLAVHRSDVTVNTVPHYDVEVTAQESARRVERMERKEQRSHSGQSVKARFKYDHLIRGWDLREGNDAPRLEMTTRMLFGMGMSQASEDWIQKQVRERLMEQDRQTGIQFENENGQLERIRMDETILPQYMDSSEINDEYPQASTRGADDDENENTDTGRTGEGDDNVEAEREDDRGDDTNPLRIRRQYMQRARLIGKNRLEFADDYERVGRMGWVNEVEVDGETDQMQFQLFGVFRFDRDVRDFSFHGVMAVGGFSYPGGESIFHDPEYVCDAQTIFVGDGSQGSDDVEDDDSGRPSRVLLFMGIIAVAAVVAVAVCISAGKPGKPQPSPETEGYSDREGYYRGFHMDQPKR